MFDFLLVQFLIKPFSRQMKTSKTPNVLSFSLALLSISNTAFKKLPDTKPLNVNIFILARK